MNVIVAIRFPSEARTANSLPQGANHPDSRNGGWRTRKTCRVRERGRQQHPRLEHHRSGIRPRHEQHRDEADADRAPAADPDAAAPGRLHGAAAGAQGHQHPARQPADLDRRDARPGHLGRQADRRLEQHVPDRRPAHQRCSSGWVRRGRQPAGARRSDGQTAAAGPAAQDGVLELSLGAGDPVEVQVSAGDTAATIATRINQTAGSQVYAGVVDGKLVLSGKQTGQANTITVAGSAAPQFGFVETQAARDAAYTIDGVQHSSASNVVTDGLVGVTLTLKAVTTGSVSVVVGTPSADTDAIKTSVQGFVDQYNSTVSFILGKLNERPVVNATNDADRIKGVLYGDPTLRNLLSSMRATVAASNDSNQTMASLLQVGVSTGAAAAGGTPNPDALAGKLTLDTTALTTALTNDFARTKAQFTTVSDDPTVPAAVGKLDTVVKRFGNGANGLLKGQIDSQQSQINSLVQQSNALDLRLKTKEASLRARFTAMETALAQSQAQGQSIASSISQLMSGK